MKGLNGFFDWSRFAHGKVFTATACMPWLDYETKQKLGTRIDVYISQDDTAYRHRKDGSVFSNLGEKFSIKVPGDVKVDIGSLVVPVDPEVTVYGQYNDKMSVQAKDIKVITGTGKD